MPQAVAKTIADPRIRNGRPMQKSTSVEIAELRMVGAERPPHSFVTGRKRARHRFIRVLILTIDGFTGLGGGRPMQTARCTCTVYLERQRRVHLQHRCGLKGSVARGQFRTRRD